MARCYPRKTPFVKQQPPANYGLCRNSKIRRNNQCGLGRKRKARTTIRNRLYRRKPKTGNFNYRAFQAFHLSSRNAFTHQNRYYSPTKNDFSLDKIIEKLHPTPAVCGLPKDLSKEYILANEGYDRKFYSGFLGELNVDENKTSELYV